MNRLSPKPLRDEMSVKATKQAVANDNGYPSRRRQLHSGQQRGRREVKIGPRRRKRRRWQIPRTA
jgi:hypothetical protein